MGRPASNARWRHLAAAAVVLLSACGGDQRGIEQYYDPDRDPDYFFAGSSSVMQVSGTISGDPPAIEFEPVSSFLSEEQLDVEPGPWTITVETTNGSIDVPFGVGGEVGAGQPPIDFTLNLQPSPGVRVVRIGVSLAGEEIGAIEGNDTYPSLSIINRIEDKIPIDDLVVEWESDDPDALVSVYLTVDGGTTWKRVTDWSADPVIRVPPEELAPADEAQLDVRISDGINAFDIRTDPFTLVAADG